MSVVSVYGVDPGLVHTGVVMMAFHQYSHRVVVGSTAVIGPDAVAVANAIGDLDNRFGFIEAYRPRSNFNTDARMTKAVADMKAAMPKAKVLNNTGVKTIVKPDLMRALHVWKFKTTTHHDDLRSAARIALLGMMKDEHLNKVLADFVADYLKGDPWDVLS